MIQDCMRLRDKKTIILSIPLLFEAKFNDLCTEIWLIKCSKETQKQRLIVRDCITNEEAENILNIQSNGIDKEKNSDVVINTDKELKIWKELIDKLI